MSPKITDKSKKNRLRDKIIKWRQNNVCTILYKYIYILREHNNLFLSYTNFIQGLQVSVEILSGATASMTSSTEK